MVPTVVMMVLPLDFFTFQTTFLPASSFHTVLRLYPLTVRAIGKVVINLTMPWFIFVRICMIWFYFLHMTFFLFPKLNPFLTD